MVEIVHPNYGITNKNSNKFQMKVILRKNTKLLKFVLTPIQMFVL